MADRNARAEQLRDEANEAEGRAADSWERSDTDGFVSQWASGITAREKRAQATIEENGGTATFPGLFKDGERVRAKIIPTKFGTCWAMLDDSDNFTGEFVGRGPRSLKKAGCEERDEQAPAKAITWAPPGARGLSGATSVQVLVIRTDGGYPGAKSHEDDEDEIEVLEYPRAVYHPGQKVRHRGGFTFEVAREVMRDGVHYVESERGKWFPITQTAGDTLGRKAKR